MILIFGGAYQGKLDYALKRFDLEEKNVFHCDMESMVIDFDRKIIADLDRFILACIKEDVDPRECLEDNIDRLKDKVIICSDNSEGVVPMDPTERAWREMCGRCMVYLGQQAEEVWRVFCGIPTRIKPEGEK